MSRREWYFVALIRVFLLLSFTEDVFYRSIQLPFVLLHVLCICLYCIQTRAQLMGRCWLEVSTKWLKTSFTGEFFECSANNLDQCDDIAVTDRATIRREWNGWGLIANIDRKNRISQENWNFFPIILLCSVLGLNTLKHEFVVHSRVSPSRLYVTSTSSR